MEKKSVKQNMIFNTVGSLVYYVCQWLMSVVIVRISGYEDAGILSLAMTVTAAPAIVGLFNIRSYQVSDIEGQYSDATYLRSRVTTNLLSYIVCLFMVLIGGYSLEKAGVILLFMLFKVAEGFADVYYGIEQKWQRMDYAGISMTIRGIGTIVSFVVVFLLTKSLFLAVVAVALFSFLVIICYDRRIIRRVQSVGDKSTDWSQVRSLLLVCLPLAIVAFLNNLSINLPKIYLEKYFGSEVMGYYNSVASPTVVVQLAATTIFAPLIPILTEQYQEGDKQAFLKTLRKFGGLVLGLSIICLIGAKLLGYLGLVLLFGESIADYVPLFVPVIVVSIFIAINASLFSLCTLLREIRLQYLIGAAGVLSSFLLSIVVVRAESMLGVVYALLGTLAIQIVIQLALIIRKVRRM